MTLRQIIFITVVFSNFAYSQVPNYVPQNGLVGWWPFNGNANDETGNGNNGVVNGATLSTDRFGNSNKAYSFVGTTNCQNITISNSTQLNPNNITINCWINALDSNMTILEKSDPSNASKLSYAVTFKDEFQGMNGLKTSYGIGNCTFSAQNPAFWSPQSTYPNNSWIMITVKINSNGDIAQYLNSNLVYSANGTQSFIPCNDALSTLRIGGVHWNNDPECFKGYIDDLGIWNRDLTQQEINDLYNGCQLTLNTQPSSQTININNNAEFIVGSSDLSATYQWQTDLGVGFQNLNNVGQYSGVTNDTLIISNVTQNNNNQPFRCLISTGSCTETSDTATLTVSNNVGVQDISEDNLYSIYPNPTNDVLIINAEKGLIGENYFLEDNLGKTILRGKITAETTGIDVNQLTEGIYFLKVGKNLQQVTKIIKAK
jgi:hypothetical protein